MSFFKINRNRINIEIEDGRFLSSRENGGLNNYG